MALRYATLSVVVIVLAFVSMIYNYNGIFHILAHEVHTLSMKATPPLEGKCSRTEYHWDLDPETDDEDNDDDDEDDDDNDEWVK
ncbi:hypothetical protein F52700_4580 [Fusarium sp. NRRL 52700]|nr:hypothetical protein F52700_4580 [Fusarium sp. NRRL 52700]